MTTNLNCIYSHRNMKNYLRDNIPNKILYDLYQELSSHGAFGDISEAFIFDRIFAVVERLKNDSTPEIDFEDRHFNRTWDRIAMKGSVQHCRTVCCVYCLAWAALVMEEKKDDRTHAAIIAVERFFKSYDYFILTKQYLGEMYKDKGNIVYCAGDYIEQQNIGTQNNFYGNNPTSQEDDSIVKELLPVFFNNEEEVQKYLSAIKGQSGKAIAELSRQLVDKGVIAKEMSRKILYDILVKNNLYPNSLSNWNQLMK